jgi:CHASE2 domain-containing sensor protein
VPSIAGGILLTLLYTNTALFRNLETTALDVQMLLKKPAENSDVVVVRITDDDYQKLFSGKSPLDLSALRTILQAIASGRPKVIGVDLDTSSKDFRSLIVPPDWPPIVWARDATYSKVNQKYVLSNALGGYNPCPQSGLVTLKLDPDGAVRRYTRWYSTDAGDYPSFPVAILRQIRNEKCGDPAPLADLDADRFIDFASAAKFSQLVSPPASQIVEMSGQESWANSDILKDKIVILGGDYSVQDEHDTPVGWMLGAEILASIIETEQKGGGRRPISRPMILLIAIFDGIVLLLLIHLWGLFRTLLLSILLIPALAVVFSLIFFSSVIYVGYFIPILIAVLVQQAYEKGKEYNKTLREHAAGKLE